MVSKQKGYNAYATGSVTHFDAAKLLEDYGNSVYTHEMTHNSDGAIYFEGYGRREGLGAELYIADSCSLRQAQMNQLLRSILSSKVDKVLRHVCIPIISRNVFKMQQTFNTICHGMFDMIYLGLSRRYLYAEAE